MSRPRDDAPPKTRGDRGPRHHRESRPQRAPRRARGREARPRGRRCVAQGRPARECRRARFRSKTFPDVDSATHARAPREQRASHAARGFAFSPPPTCSGLGVTSGAGAADAMESIRALCWSPLSSRGVRRARRGQRRAWSATRRAVAREAWVTCSQNAASRGDRAFAWRAGLARLRPRTADPRLRRAPSQSDDGRRAQRTLIQRERRRRARLAWWRGPR